MKMTEEKKDKLWMIFILSAMSIVFGVMWVEGYEGLVVMVVTYHMFLLLYR